MRCCFALAVLALLMAGTIANAAATQPASDDPENLLVNGGAERARNNAQPAAWEEAYIPSQGLRLTRDPRQAKAGVASFYIENRHQYDQPTVNNWRQDLKTLPVGRILQVSGYIKTLGAEDGVNICIQCWADDQLEKMVGFESTRVLKGDNEWTAVKSRPLVVPKDTTLIVVRAGLSGKGKAWFDEIVLKEVRRSLAEPATREASAETLDKDLVRQIEGKVVSVLPVARDQMVLSYLPDWAHGNVDNIAVANNDGGVRTLLAWPAVDAKHVDSRFLLAMYARDAVSKGDAGAIGAYEVLSDWDESTSWARQPKIAEKPVAEYAFENAKGWRVFDVTLLATQASRGVMLRFLAENQTSETWSGYAFVSREGEGEWADKHPLLLIVR